MGTARRPHHRMVRFTSAVGLLVVAMVASACSGETAGPAPTSPSDPAKAATPAESSPEPTPALSGDEIWEQIEPALLALLDPNANADPATWRSAGDVVRAAADQASTQAMTDTLIALAAVTDSGIEYAKRQTDSSDSASTLSYFDIEEALDEAVSDFQDSCPMSGPSAQECAGIWEQIEPALLALLDPEANDDPATWRRATEVVSTVSEQVSMPDVTDTLVAISAVAESGAEYAEQQTDSPDNASALSYLEIEEALDGAVSSFQEACVASGSSEQECGLVDSDGDSTTGEPAITSGEGECRQVPDGDDRFVYVDEQPAVSCDSPHTARVLGRQESAALDVLPPKGVLPDALQEPYIKTMSRDYAWCDDLASQLVPDIHSTVYGYNLMYEESGDGQIIARCELTRMRFDLGTQDAFHTDVREFPPSRANMERVCLDDEFLFEDCATAEFEFRNSTRLNTDGDTPYPGEDAARDLARDACPGPFAVGSDEIGWAMGGIVVCRYETK